LAWTTPKTWSAGETLTAANFNAQIRDNELAMGPHLIARKSSDQSVTSSTALVDCTSMVLAVAANEIWQARFCVLWVGDPAGDLKIAFTFPAGGEIIFSTVAESGAGTLSSRRFDGTTSDLPALNFQAYGATTKEFIVIEGVFITAGTAGNVQMRFAQDVSNGTATKVLTNSTLWAVKLA
jgi:hypothetical protein